MGKYHNRRNLWANDRALVAAVKAGTAGAAETFVARFQSLLFAATLRQPTLSGQAEDLVQKTFLTAFASLGKLRKTTSVCTWILGILRNHIRATRKGGPKETGTIARILCNLPDPHRSVLTLRYLWGLGNLEISREVGLKVKAVETIIHRTRKVFGQTAEPKLKDLLDSFPTLSKRDII